MDTFRKKVVGIALAIMALMGLFPPWSVTGGPGSNYPGVVFSLGYHPLFAAPFVGEISFGRLFAQWALVGIISVAAIYFEPPILIWWDKARNHIGR